MPLGKEVSLGPSDIVIDGDPVGTQSLTAASSHFRPVPIVAKRSPISATAELLLIYFCDTDFPRPNCRTAIFKNFLPPGWQSAIIALLRNIISKSFCFRLSLSLKLPLEVCECAFSKQTRITSQLALSLEYTADHNEIYCTAIKTTTYSSIVFVGGPKHEYYKSSMTDGCHLKYQ